MIKVDALHKIKNFKKVTKDHCPSFSGIVAGECKGNLWVDDTEAPNIAIADSYAVGSFAFLGNIQSEEAYRKLKEFINFELFPMLKAKEINYFEFTIEDDDLRKPVLKMFDDREIQKEKEFSFRKNNSMPKVPDLPEGYTIHKVDDKLWKLINEGNIENGEFLTRRIMKSWEDFNDFYKKSLSFCIMHSNKIISVIAGTARFNNNIPIDIETDETHRKKGLGLILTERFVNECVSRGLTAQWDCVESNPISKKLAEKAGFKFIKQNEVYWFGI